MDTVLCVDLQPGIVIIITLDDLIDSRRTVTLFWCVIQSKIMGDWYRCVFERQMRRLILLMVFVPDRYTDELRSKLITLSGFG